MGNDIEIVIQDISQIADIIASHEINCTHFELENCRKNRGVILRVCELSSSKKNNSCIDKVQLLNLIDNYFQPIINGEHTDFILSVFRNNEQLPLTNVNLFFRTKCNNGNNMHEALRKPFKYLLPFAKYIHSIEFRGDDYKLNDVEANINMKLESFKKIIEEPKISIELLKQWYSISSVVYAEVKQSYQYINKMVCIQGKMYWDCIV